MCLELVLYFIRELTLSDLEWTSLLHQEPSETDYESHYGGPVRAGGGPDVCPGVTVRVEPAEQSLAQGGDTVLRCEGAGPGDSVTWEKVGSDLGASSLTVTRDSLAITAASVTDRGLYVCNVETSCGAQGRASSLLEVRQIFLKYFSYF